jgi:hypothetical protein
MKLTDINAEISLSEQQKNQVAMFARLCCLDN